MIRENSVLVRQREIKHDQAESNNLKNPKVRTVWSLGYEPQVSKFTTFLPNDNIRYMWDIIVMLYVGFLGKYSNQHVAI